MHGAVCPRTLTPRPTPPPPPTPYPLPPPRTPPQLFPLGDTGQWMLVGSLYSTNQWWVGSLAGSPPVFTPSRVGIMDYGNGYAAKTGTTFAAAGGDRRVVFGFTGWTEPSADPACGRAFIIPRDLTLGADGASPRINPIPELVRLRNVTGGTSALVVSTGASGAPAASTQLVGGVQVWVSIVCSLPSPPPSSGAVFARVLASPDGATAYTEVGYDFAAGALYVDHSRCCAAPNAIVQRAPAPAADMDGGTLNVTVLVDGSLIEAFAGGLVTITALVSPDAASGGAAVNRTASFTNAAGLEGVSCFVQSWQVLPVAPAERRGYRRHAHVATAAATQRAAVAGVGAGTVPPPAAPMTGSLFV
jgi:hypothetical protein